MVAELGTTCCAGKRGEASIGLGAVAVSPAVNQLGMVEDAEQPHIGDMKKSPRVTFKMQRIAEGDWQIVAECPGAETQYIKGLKSKEEVDEWLAGTRRIAWLRSQGYAK
jgi:hypothetical protein